MKASRAAIEGRPGASGAGAAPTPDPGHNGAPRANGKRPKGPRIFAVFADDDAGYLRWLEQHPDSVVLNCPRRQAPGNLIIHRASCPTIAAPPKPGTLRTKQAMKVCATWPEDLVAWARARGAGAARHHQRCHP